MTPEQEARAEAENDPLPTYSDGRPKYHRHFMGSAIHRDDIDCGPEQVGRRIRVYVFDTEDLEEHERFLSERAFDDGVEAGTISEWATPINPFRGQA